MVLRGGKIRDDRPDGDMTRRGGHPMIGVTSFGSYIPRLRLSRKAIAESNGWMEPSLLSLGKGERSMCNWDEDAVTMAVDAARDCLAGVDRSSVEGLYLAST